MTRMCAVVVRPEREAVLPGSRRRTSPKVGDKVLVPTDEGPEVAECVWAPEWVGEAGRRPARAAPAGHRGGPGPRPPMRRKRRAAGAGGGQAAVARARPGDEDRRRRLRHHRQPLHRLLHRAPHRVDFRAAGPRHVRTLGRAPGSSCASSSARDEARVQGGIGPCGRDLCCSTFLKDFEPVSVRMAKDQDLPLNPLQISGACGKLMCCLKYEHPLYAQFKATAPAVGETVDTEEGRGRVVESRRAARSGGRAPGQRRAPHLLFPGLRLRFPARPRATLIRGRSGSPSHAGW